MQDRRAAYEFWTRKVRELVFFVSSILYKTVGLITITILQSNEFSEDLNLGFDSYCKEEQQIFREGNFLQICYNRVEGSICKFLLWPLPYLLFKVALLLITRLRTQN